MTHASWIDWLEDKIGHLAIPHITRGIVILNALVFILGGINPTFTQSLTLDPYVISNGEFWRLITFLFVPETTSILFVIFYLLFTWWVGDALEAEWGAFKVNLYWLIGMISLALVAFFLVGYQVNNAFLYSSLILVFGTLFPRVELMLFPIPLPIQARFLAIFDAIILAIYFIFHPSLRYVILASIVNYLLFFIPSFISDYRAHLHSKKRLKAFRKDN